MKTSDSQIMGTSSSEMVCCLDKSSWSVLRSRFMSSAAINKSYPCIHQYTHRVFPDHQSVINYLLVPDSLVPCFPDLCPECWSTGYIRITHQGYRVCAHCGIVIDEHCIETSPFSAGYGLPVPIQVNTTFRVKREASTDYVKRLSHFRHWIKCIRGFDTKRITKQDIESIKGFMEAHHLDQENPLMVRFSLQRLRRPKLYPYVNYIVRCLTGKVLVDLSEQHVRILCQMFMEVQPFFVKSAHVEDRTNMISYSYLIAKMSQALGWSDLSNAMVFPKSRFKLLALDRLWKEMCHRMQLPFLPSQA